VGVQGGSQIATRMDHFPGSSAVLPTLREGLEIDLSYFGTENAMLNGDYWWQVVEIVIEGVPTVLEVHCMYLIMSLGRILLQSLVSTNQCDPMSYHVDLRNDDVSIYLLGSI